MTFLDATLRHGDERPLCTDASGTWWSGAAFAAYAESVLERVARERPGFPATIAFVPRSDVRSAATLVGLIASASAAPLAASSGRDALEQDMKRLSVDALFVDEATPDAAVDAARACAVPTIDARALDLGTDARDARRRGATVVDQGALDGTGLLLSTSGTTSTPKTVPLRRTSLLASAKAVAATLSLDSDDVCLSIMPLHHVHGIVAALLAPLVSSGRLVFAGEASSSDAIATSVSNGVTWTTAVPTRLLDLLRSVPDNGDKPLPALRVVRSSSSPLAVEVLHRLEGVFGVPVLEAYGMTECAHQIASNPLPPGVRVPGTVGFATGVDLAVLGDDGRHLPAGLPGTVVVRGPTVTLGYLDHATSGWIVDVDGGRWFDTGDVGHLDDAGRLTLVGRAKEMIDRGGENVAPSRIDEVLCAHPDVQEALAFAIPHGTLGEDVGVAVVPSGGSPFDAIALRAWAFAHLRPHEVPSVVVAIDRLPRSASGKPKRSAVLALVQDRLGAPPAPLEGTLETIVGNAFDVALSNALVANGVGRDSNFFLLGGDSLTGARLAMALQESLHVSVSASDIFAWPTPRLLAAVLGGRIDARVTELGLDDADAPI